MDDGGEASNGHVPWRSQQIRLIFELLLLHGVLTLRVLDQAKTVAIVGQICRALLSVGCHEVLSLLIKQVSLFM